MGKYTYLYESESYRDYENKRPNNDKESIGKIDLVTGELVYRQEYLCKLVSAGKSITGMRAWDKTIEVREQIGRGGHCAIEAETAQIIIDSIVDFRVVYFLRDLSERIGLLGIMRYAMPHVWKEEFCLACYLIAEDKPVMYCEDWLASNHRLDAGSMSSHRVSDLLIAFGCSDVKQRLLTMVLLL